MKEKIQLSDRVDDILFKMSEGNPGALNVCMQILTKASRIDPDDAFQALGPILTLDSLGIHGCKIWMLYKDVCKEDLPRMLAVLRGRQLGFVNDQQILHAIDNYGDGINIEDIADRVVKRLPRFQSQVTTKQTTKEK